MVRLKVVFPFIIVVVFISFNSNMVRLKVLLGLFYYTLLLVFQFQYGTIKSFSNQKRSLCIRRFNSNMVRLKDSQREEHGSSPQFQFQYGTIKRTCDTHVSCEVSSFNSNMVRLKACLNLLISSTTMFQFQYGTIKSH